MKKQPWHAVIDGKLSLRNLSHERLYIKALNNTLHFIFHHSVTRLSEIFFK